MPVNTSKYARLHRMKGGLAKFDLTVSDRTREKRVSELPLLLNPEKEWKSKRSKSAKKAWEDKKAYKVKEPQCLECTRYCKQWNNPEVTFICVVSENSMSEV